MTKAVIHIHANAAGKARREKRDGRETIILPSYAAKAESVLNGIKYPRDELDKSLAGLNRTPAPFGHPVINGKFVPALDPEALARNHVFAWNENPKWDGDRIAVDVVIDEARAQQSEDGKTILKLVNEGKPISTSTGLMCTLDTVNADDHKSVARGIVWDHIAILTNEKPAIGPDKGVGIFVNSADGDIEVINSSLTDQLDQEIDWAGTRLVDALRRRENAGAWDKMKSTIMQALGMSDREVTTNKKEDDMPVTDEQFKALSDQVSGLADGMKGIGETIASAVTNAVKPLVEANEALVNAQKAKDDEELTGLRETIVKANMMDADAAKELTLNAARALAKTAKPGTAAALHNGLGKTETGGFKLPSAE